MLWTLVHRDVSVRLSSAGFGSMLARRGWDNLIGVIGHHVLDPHHVTEDLGESMWDWMPLLPE